MSEQLAPDQDTDTTRVFISYSRKDQTFVRQLHERLLAAGLETWVDWEGIPPSADWWAEIQQAIDGSDAFAFVISPNSLASEVCAREIEAAVQHNKRFVPILYLEPEKETIIHPKISAHNWLFMRDEAEVEKNMGTMVETINTDLGWVKLHTRLLERAVEWENSGSNSSFLLRGDDLKRAEQWLAEAADKEPAPSELQAQYIRQSRRDATRRRRMVAIGVAIGVVIALLAVFAFFQRNEAQVARDAAESARQVAEDSEQEARNQEAIALEARATAVSAAAEADRQRGLAEVQRDIASTNRERAEAQEAIAVEQAGIAREQKELAQIEAENARVAERLANELREEALALRTAITGELLRQQDKLTISTLVALQSLQQVQTDEAEQLLRNLLARLPAGLYKQTHGDWVNVTAISPDNDYLLTAGRDGHAIMWDVESGQMLYTIVHEGPVADAAFNPRGGTFVTGDDDSLTLWNNESGQQIRSFVTDTPVTDVTFSENGTHVGASMANGVARAWNILSGDTSFEGFHSEIATGIAIGPEADWVVTSGSEGRAYLWDLRNASAPYTLLHDGPVQGAAFSPDASRVVTYADDNSARIWNRNIRIRLSRLVHDGVVTDVAFSPDGRSVATASADGTARLWETETGRELQDFEHTDFVNTVAFSPNGLWLVTGSDDKTSSLWDIASGEEVSRMVHESPITDVAFSANGQFLVTATQSGTFHLWDVGKDRPESGRAAHESFVTDLAFSGDGERLITISADGVVRYWDVTETLTGTPEQEPTTLLEAGVPLKNLALSDDGTQVAATGADLGAYVWDVETEALLNVLAPESRVSDIAFSADGATLLIAEQLATTGGESVLRLTDLASGDNLFETNLGVRSWAVAFSPDDAHFVVATDDGLVRVFDADTFEELYQLAHNEAALSVVFSSDGQLLVTGSADDTARVWELATGEALMSLPHGNNVNDLTFSAEGDYLLTASGDGNMRFWDTTTWQEVARIPHTDTVTSVAVHPNGQLIASGSNILGTLWDVDNIQFLLPEQLADEACSRLVRNLTESEWQQYIVVDGAEESSPYHLLCPDLPAG